MRSISQGVADAMQYHISCAYTHLFTKRDLDEAAAHLQVASLVAMLCDGCRVDGRGFGSVPLDELLWRFGILVLEALQLKDVDFEEDPQRYAWAAGTAARSEHWFASTGGKLFSLRSFQNQLKNKRLLISFDLIFEALTSLKHLNTIYKTHHVAGASQVSSFPPATAWRGGQEQMLFGRPKCQAVLRPPKLGTDRPESPA